MARLFCIPGIVFLFCAFVLSLLVSISLPSLTALDIARVHFNDGSSTGISNSTDISQLRFGVWSYCTDSATSGSRTCSHTGHAYSVTVQGSQNHNSVTIGSAWTRGLAVHPVATVVIFIALLLSFSQHITVTLLSSVISFLAALLTLIAFAIDIALFAFVKHEMGKLGDAEEHTITAPGFWLTFVSLILLLLGGCTVCLGRRRDRSAGKTYPMTETRRPFWSRFRRN